MKRRRLVILLSIPVAMLSMGMLLAGWVLNSDGGAAWLLSRVSNSLEGQLSMGKVTGNLNDGLVIADLHFEEQGMEIVVMQLETVVGFSLIPLQVNVRSLHAADLKIILAGTEPTSQDISVTIEDVLAGLKLPITIVLDEVVMTTVELSDVDQGRLLLLDRITLSGRWKDVIELRQFTVEAPSLTAGVRGSIALSPPFGNQWSGDGKIVASEMMVGFEFALNGVADDYALELQAILDTAGLPAISFTLTGQGNMEGLTVGSFAADSEFLHSTATGTVGWAGAPSIDLEVEVQRFAAGLWVPEWPNERYVYGRLALRVEDSSIAVQQFSAKVSGTGMVLEGAGELDLQAELVEAGFSWQKFTWPVGLDAYELSSNKGQLLVSGSPADWHFEGSLEVDTPQYPGGSFELEGGGGTDSAEISIGKGELLGGTVAGHVSLDWSGDLRWDAQLELKQVNTSAFIAGWPAKLDAKLKLSQNLADDAFDIQFDSLHGEFKGLSVDGSGGIAVHKSAIRFKTFRLHSGSSKISLDGDLNDPLGLEFSLDINKPGWMADYLGGEMSGRGRIALQAPQPVLDIEIEAHDLEWGDIRIESVVITPGAGNAAGGLNLGLAAHKLEFGSLNLQSVNAIIAGDRDRQTLNLSVSANDHELVAKFAGHLSGWDTWADNAWSGQLIKLALTSNDEVLASLRDPAPLTVSSAGISLGKTCLDITISGGLCLESGWQANGQFDFAASLSTLPLELSQLIYDHQIEFTQTLDGEIQWTSRPGTYPSGSAAIRISAGHFGDEQNKNNHVVTAEGFFGFKLINGNLTAGEFDIPFPGIGQIDLDYAITDLALDGKGKIDGKIGIELNDISVLQPLLPGLEQIGGQFNIDLQVSGSVLDPALDGYVSLQNGTADISRLGTQLRQVQLKGSVTGMDTALLQGDFMAGDGHGKITVETEFSDWSAPAMKMTLSGTSLRLFNTAELRMDADTDIRLVREQGEWTIDGGIVVQQARIAPITFVVSKVTESEDIQLVAGTLPPGGADKAAVPVKLTGSLEISLGDKVKIDTELAKAKLSGSVSLAWDGEVIPIATGSIHADGTLSVFGPKLHVKDGQLRFPEVPVNNPVLEIRAERDVFGNTQIRTAGVSITGPARHPVIEAYTNPLTTNDRAWALLITGSDVDYGQGVGAFEVGTYIAPRLYLSYGISLFDDDNVVSARYDLKRGFGVKATSGQRESGIDMSYTIDR